MRSPVLAVLALALTACADDERALEGRSVAELEVKKKALADQALQAHLQKGAINQVAPLREYAEEDAGSPAGVGKAAALPGDTELPKPVVQADPGALLRGWQKARVGDFVTVSCAHFVNKFGNRVRRRVQLRLDVVAADAKSVIVRVRGTGNEEHDSSHPEVKRRHWTAEFKGAGELVMQREADETLGIPIPARNLAPPVDRPVDLGKRRLPSRCSQLPTPNEEDKVERCVAAEPADLYLTAGLVSELSALTRNGCHVTSYGGVEPPKRSAADGDGFQFAFTRRGDAEFRERALLAAGGLVKLEVQRLRYVRAAEPGSVLFEGKHYAPSVTDTKRLQLLDWAIQRVMPEYPLQLPVE